MQPRTPLWLSHHYPAAYDRCIRIGNKHVCRRCSFFYPAAFGVTLAALAGLRWPQSWDAAALFALPIPVVAEWWGEQLGRLRYRPMRNTLLTIVCAPAVGVGLARYLRDPGDGLFWSVVGVYAVVCIAPVLLRWRRTTRGVNEERTAPRRSPEPAPRREAGRVR
ncbi:MAG: hypothetical protein R2716_07495 [Microthrixaceae bacterium]